MVAWEDEWQRGDVLGDYTLVARLGEGGISRVYEGRHTQLGTRVAIKTLRPELRRNAMVRARFEREGLATARVAHPHVVRVITVGQHREAPYLVMEFLSGEDLDRRIKARGAMALDEALRLLVPVLSAVQAAHDEGLVHRDLKPANIMIESTRDGRERPVVVDFGIARVDDGPHDHVKTRGSALVGTPAYMSPEQTRGAREVSAASDQYALGVILYECLAGVVAFDGVAMLELLTRVATGTYTPLRLHRPELPVELEAIVARAMALDPAARFSSVRDLALALLPYADAVTRTHHAPTFRATPPPPARDISDEPTRPLQTPSGAVAPAGWPTAPAERAAADTASMRHRTTLGGAAHEFPIPAQGPTSSRTLTTLGAMAVVALLTLLVGAVVIRGRRGAVPASASPTHARSSAPPVTPLPAAPVAVQPAAPSRTAPAPTPSTAAETTSAAREAPHPTHEPHARGAHGRRNAPGARHSATTEMPQTVLSVPPRPTPTESAPRNCVGPNGTNLCL